MRTWIIGLACLILVAGLGGVTYLQRQAPRTEIAVYKTPTCGCCSKWEDHLRNAGFDVSSRIVDDVNQVKNEKGVPFSLRSCHTAIVENYVVEGHVPADSIQKLLREAPQDVRGIAVPGMPIGSPGMEGPNPEKYEVLSFGEAGEKVFARY